MQESFGETAREEKCRSFGNGATARRSSGPQKKRVGGCVRDDTANSPRQGDDLRPDCHAPGKSTVSPGRGVGLARMPARHPMAPGGQCVGRLLHRASSSPGAGPATGPASCRGGQVWSRWDPRSRSLPLGSAAKVTAPQGIDFRALEAPSCGSTTLRSSHARLTGIFRSRTPPSDKLAPGERA